jgi:hypothetical protein
MCRPPRARLVYGHDTQQLSSNPIPSAVIPSIENAEDMRPTEYLHIDHDDEGSTSEEEALVYPTS